MRVFAERASLPTVFARPVFAVFAYGYPRYAWFGFAEVLPKDGEDQRPASHLTITCANG